MDDAATSGVPVTPEVEPLRARLAELEQIAARRARELTALHEIALEIGQLTDLNTLLRAIVEKAAGLLNAHMGGLYLVHPESQTLELVVAHNLPGISAGVSLKMGEGLSGRIAQTGQVLTVPDYQAWAGQAAVYAGAPFRRVVGVPLKVGEKVIGVINITDEQQTGDFAEDEVRLVTLFAEQAAIAVEKAQLLAEVQSDLAERQRAEQIQAAIYRVAEAAQAARGLGELYQAIHQIVNELLPARNFYLALYDATSDTVSFPYFVDEIRPTIAGFARQHAKGLTEYVLRRGESWLGTGALIQELLDQGEIENIGPMAESWLGVPLRVDGETIGLIAVQSYSERVRLTVEHQSILQYVSAQVAMAVQRKRTEEALRESEEKYRILFASDLVAISLFEMTSLQFLDVNDAFVRMYGYSREELLSGMTVRDVSAEPEQSASAIQQARTGGTVSVPLRYHRRKDGTVFPVELVSGPYLWQGRTVFFAWIQDITDRKRAEAALRESEQRYHDLFEAAQRQAQELTLLDRVRTAVTGELDLSELFRTVVTAVAETFGYTLVSLYMLEEQHLRLQYQVGYDLVLHEIPITSGVIGRIARTGQPELIEDVFAEPAFLAAMDDIISEIGVPLFDAGRVVGVLNIESTRGYHLTEADLHLMIALSEHVNSAISRARLYTEARQNAARLTAAVESLPFDFWALGPDHRYVLQNTASTQHWGRRIGMRVSQLDIPENLRAHWEANDRRAFAGEVVEGEVTFEVDGERHHFHEVIAPIWSEGEIAGILGVNIDITDRQRAEAALRTSEARLRAVTSNIPVILFALDQYGIFTFAEGHRLEAVGGSAEDLIGRSVFEVIRGASRAIEAIQLALDGEALNITLEMNQRLLEMWLSPLVSPQGELNGVIGVAVDITERERTEEALRRAQKMESLGLLAGGIAHDFNNLLVAILGQASLALSQLSADSPARAPIEKAAAASRRAADLTRQLLAYSGRGQFERRPLDLNRLIQENLHLFEVAVPKNVMLRSELTVPLPVIVGDAGQLQQVIMNTIINAAEAIGERSGQVMVRTRVQCLTSEATAAWQIGDEELPPGDYVQLVIVDNGQGMDAETLSRIFDPFFSTKFTGRGLGLAAVLGIVRGHGGGLKVSSAPHVGTTFEIVFPVGAAEAVEPVMHEALPQSDVTRQVVLVIDDEEPVRDAVTDILDLEGLPVLTASNGRAGIDLYRQRQADIGLILLDLSMPGLSGEETFQELRQINARVRVLLSSGYSQDEVAARFGGQNEVGFIQKPYDAEQLVREVKRYLAQPPVGQAIDGELNTRGKET